MTSRLNYAPAGKPTLMKRRGFAKFVAHPPNPKKKKCCTVVKMNSLSIRRIQSDSLDWD